MKVIFFILCHTAEEEYVLYKSYWKAEHHIPKKIKILFCEQAPTQYLNSFWHMAELLLILSDLVNVSRETLSSCT